MTRSTPCLTVAVAAAPRRPAAQLASPVRWWQGWLPLAVLPAAVIWLLPVDWPRWALTWWLAWAILFACKWLTWRRTPNSSARLWRHVGYLVGWVGMDAARFLDSRVKPAQPSLGEWLFAGGKTAIGVCLLYGVTHRLPQSHPQLVGWTGLAGIVMALHFGLFHLLSCAWRQVRVEARPVMNWPLAAASTSDLWRRRWNTAFHDLAHRFVFRPLAPRLAQRRLWAGFLASGLLHDLVISFPARGGYRARERCTSCSRRPPY